MSNNIKERNVGIDILRIILALMVITIHFNARATGNVANVVTWMPTKLLAWSFLWLSYPAVNCYVLISGFFSYKHHKGYLQTFQSLIKLWLSLIFFSLLGYLAYLLFCDSAEFHFSTLISRLFPILSGEWWYMSIYFMLLLISPILNNAVDAMTIKMGGATLVVMLLFGSVAPFFFKFNDPFGMVNGSGLIWFVIMYITGALMFKFCAEPKISYPKIKFFILYMVSTLGLVVWGRLQRLSPIFSGYTVAMYNSLFVYIQAIALFMLFYNLRIQSVKLQRIVTWFAGLSMASYILHCQADVDKFLWKTVNPSQYANSLTLIPVYVAVVLSVFFLAVAIEYCRKRVFYKFNIETKLIDLFVNKIWCKIV